MVLKKLIKGGLVCLLFYTFCSANFVAAAAGEIKIGIMNVQKVLVQSEAGKQAGVVLEKKGKELEEKFSGDGAAIAELQKEIEKKGSVWSKEKKDEKVLEFNKMRRDLQTKSEDGRLEMKRLQEKELAPILKTLETVVDRFGKNNG